MNFQRLVEAKTQIGLVTGSVKWVNGGYGLPRLPSIADVMVRAASERPTDCDVTGFR